MSETPRYRKRALAFGVFPHLSVGEGEGSGDPTGGADPASDPSGSGTSQPGTQATADSFAADRERLETRARQEQARADRAEAQLRELQAASSKPETGTQEDGKGATLDPDALVQKALSEFRRSEALRSTASKLREDEAYKYADKSLLDKAEDFESPEALTAAIEASHNRVAEVVKSEIDTVRAATQAEIAEQYGLRLAPTTPEGAAPTGDPSIEEITAMSFSEKAALDPEVLERVLRSAT